MEVEMVQKPKSTKEKNKLETAREDFEKMMKEIEPFMKKKETRIPPSSSGEWVTSEMEAQQ